MEIHFPFSPLQHVAGGKESRRKHTQGTKREERGERLSAVSLRQTALLVPFPLSETKWRKTRVVAKMCSWHSVRFSKLIKVSLFLGCFKRSHKNKCKYPLYCPVESVLFPGFVLWYSHFRESMKFFLAHEDWSAAAQKWGSKIPLVHI